MHRSSHAGKGDKTGTQQLIKHNTHCAIHTEQQRQGYCMHALPLGFATPPQVASSLKSENTSRGAKRKKGVMWKMKLEVNVKDGGECLCMERKSLMLTKKTTSFINDHRIIM